MLKYFKNEHSKEFFTYTLTNIFQKLFPFFLLPFLSRTFTPDELGLYLLFQTIQIILYPIASLSLDGAVSIVYFYLKKNKFSIFFTTVICFVFLLWCLEILAVSAVPNSIFEKINIEKKWFLYLLISAFPNFLIRNSILIFRYKSLKKLYAIFNVGFSFLSNGLALFFLYTSQLTWESFVLGALISNVIFSLSSIIYFSQEKYIVFDFSFKDLYQSLQLGVPIMFHVIGTWLSNSMNRFLLNFMIGSFATASYGIGAIFGMIVTLFQDSVNLTYTPIVYKHLSEEISDFSYIIKLSIYIYISIILVSILVSCIGYFCIGVIYGADYMESRSIVIPLVICAAFNGFYKVHVAFLFYLKKTFLISKITVLFGILNLFTAYLFIDLYGVTGAAYSAVLIQILVYICIFVLSNKYIYIYERDKVKHELFVISKNFRSIWIKFF